MDDMAASAPNFHADIPSAAAFVAADTPAAPDSRPPITESTASPITGRSPSGLNTPSRAGTTVSVMKDTSRANPWTTVSTMSSRKDAT